jgi:hypothetical protein
MVPETPLSGKTCLDWDWNRLSSAQPQISAKLVSTQLIHIPFVCQGAGALGRDVWILRRGCDRARALGP